MKGHLVLRQLKLSYTDMTYTAEGAAGTASVSSPSVMWGLNCRLRERQSASTVDTSLECSETAGAILAPMLEVLHGTAHHAEPC